MTTPEDKANADSRHIAKAWEGFERTVLPASAGAVQRAEMRKAFFGGAAVLFTAITRSELDDAAMEHLLGEIHTEVLEFGAELDVAVLQRKTEAT